jgi:hypothetical protein
MQIKTTRDTTFILTKIATLTQGVASVDDHGEKLELSLMAEGNVKWCHHCGKEVFP